MKKKDYDPKNGVTMDASFADHVTLGCEQCKRFDPNKPATLSLMCLEGSILWKRENGVSVKPQHVEKDSTHCSKEELRRAMHYK